VAGTTPNTCLLTHSPTTQGSWTSIRNQGRDGHQWWVLTATDPDAPAPADLQAAAAELAAEFPAPLPGLIEATRPESVQRWVLRDRPALKQWSNGRATLVGDAAHPTSPYAAYGAGMSIEDGYFLGRALRSVDLTDPAALAQALQSYEEPRKPHTAKQVQMAYLLGKVFHHAPAPVRPIRDFLFDHTPFLQKVAGDSNPREINKHLALMED
jgi:2-polyprenyl-6-methoxyphenol hydroxylase-like FAD-dependent oxidoreductase